MSVLLIIPLCVVGYVGVGTAYARSQAVACYQRKRRENLRDYPYSSADKNWLDSTLRREVPEMLWIRFWFWPIAFFYDRWGEREEGHVSVFGGPIVKAKRRAADLRAQADSYNPIIRACEDAADRELMRQGQAALRAQADEVDL